MAYDEQAAERLRAALSGEADVVEKRMVGGLSFMVAGHMCCGVTGNSLMIRVGAAERDRALAMPHARAMKLGGRELGGFVCIEPEGYRTDAALRQWVQQALDLVFSLPARAPSSASAGRRR